MKYNSPVNILANARDIGRWYLQQKNIVRIPKTETFIDPTSISLENTIANSEMEKISEPTLKDSLEIITKK